MGPWNSVTDKLIAEKEERKQEISTQCNETILSGFKCGVDGNTYTFSYDNEAQVNLAERWQLFQNDMITSIKVTAHKDDEDVRLTLNKEQFNELYLASVYHKENCISRYRDVFVPLIDNAVTLEQLEDIKWSNQVVHPEEPPIVVTGDATLDKKTAVIGAKTEDLTKATEQISLMTDVNGTALLELMNIIFSGMM